MATCRRPSLKQCIVKGALATLLLLIVLKTGNYVIFDSTSSPVPRCSREDVSAKLMEFTEHYKYKVHSCPPFHFLDIRGSNFDAMDFNEATYKVEKLPGMNKLNPFNKTVKMYTHSIKIDLSISKIISTTGLWEPHLADVLVAALKENPQAGLVDLGANLGFMSLLAPILGRKVVSVEPLPDNYLRLGKTVVKNAMEDYVTVLPNVVSAEANQSFHMKVEKGNIGGSKAIDSDNKAKCTLPDCIRSITMNELTKIIPFTDIVLKMDIEGKEKVALEASDDFFTSKNVRLILMEWRYVKREDRAIVSDKFSRFGFKPFVPSLNGKSLASLKPVSDVFYANNRDKFTYDMVWKR